MRINSILLIHCVLSVLAGALLATAFPQTSLAGMKVGLVIVGGVVGLASFTWARLTFAKSLMPAKDNEAANGIVELKQLVDSIESRWQAKLQEEASKSEDAVKELQDVKNFIGTIDRRKGSSSAIRDSIPSRERLERILDRYSNQLDENMKQVHSCGKELQRSVEELVVGSETQHDLVGKTTNFVEELSTRLMAICDTSEAALDASTEVRDNIENGLEQVQALVDEMKQVRNRASARERKLQTLGQHTREIESIVETIGNLSSKTDLLALNASIESVRAGEQGRGFAIVAEEVRALAEQSAEAVQDISRRIEMMQLETSQSISVASGEHSQMNEVIDRITTTLNSLQEVVNAANQSKNGLNEISDESTRQLKLTQDIVFALEQSSETTQQNRSHAEGAHWTSKSLGEISEKLQDTLQLLRRSGSTAV